MQRGRCQQYLEEGLGGLAQALGARRAIFLIDVAQAVRFVEHHQIPASARDLGVFEGSELIGRDYDLILLVEGTGHARLARFVIGLALHDDGGQRKLVIELLAPLLAQRRRYDQQDTAPALGPALGND